MALIQPIDNDEISVSSQLNDRVVTLKNYVKGRLKATKGMNTEECQTLLEALVILETEILYWL